VNDIDSLRRQMVTRKVGDTVQLTVVSPGRPARTVTVTFAERPPLV
jgi:S1-C subfamily serine protease